jgi:L-ascorbate metabolism protein UlaG (beta-lactamase superfamily)
MTLPRSDHFNGKTFFQSHHHHAVRRFDLWRWKFTSRPRPWPSHVTLSPQPPPPAPRSNEIVATWIGHATFLLQSAHANLLTDPVFSDRASPVTWAGPRRAHPPGLVLEALPRIDAVLLSHDHYDHCDLPSLHRLAARHDPLFIAPLRHTDLLTRAGARKIVELDWWENHVLPANVSITLTPSKHWSNRLGTPRNHRLWGGFFLTFPDGRRVWFVGDSGYDGPMFRGIHDRCGAPDLALVPIGAYEPRWFMAPMHMNPAEAVQLHRDVDARTSIAMHWGTFQLTDEAREDPPAALNAARNAAGLGDAEFRVVAPGESVTL